ncbi:hypothetical protein AB6A23_06135 [Paenibacillus tarimensis]
MDEIVFGGLVEDVAQATAQGYPSSTKPPAQDNGQTAKIESSDDCFWWMGVAQAKRESWFLFPPLMPVSTRRR